jgi:hypothetical protein
MRTFARRRNYITQALQFLYVTIRNSPPVKTKIMQQDKTILALTTDLLANGGFNHLKDDEISALHHLLLRLQEPLTLIQQKLLLRFWSNADAGNIPPALLYRCNAILQQYGMMPIEELCTATDIY